MELNDEILMAYVDGELPADEAEKVAQRLAEEPEAQMRLARLQRSADLVRYAIDEAAQGEPPPALLKAIQDAPTPTTRPDAFATISKLWSDVRAWMERPTPGLAALPVWGVAMAALLVAGLGLGRLTGGSEIARDVALGPIAPNSSLHDALETVGSGAPTPLPQGDFTGIATFVDQDGRFCREFDLASRGETVDLTVAVACRDAVAGQWSVEFSMEEHAASSVDETLFAPASGAMHEAVDTFVRSRVKDGPFLSTQEKALIDSGWRQP
ncbi:MAG: hypothetical protein AAF909_02705 [Pseudomonadota bacterium]